MYSVVSRSKLQQIAWLSIGLASLRFRKAWIQQGRPLEELKFHVRWTWPWGPYFVVRETLSEAPFFMFSTDHVFICFDSLWVLYV